MKNLFWIACIAAFAIGCSSGEQSSTDTTGSTGSTTAGKPGPSGTDSGSTPTPGATTASYIDVQEILSTSCVGCHGDSSPKGGLALTSYESVMKGGEDGPVIVAGDPEKSKLVMALHGSGGVPLMPKNGTPLPEDKIKKIEDWIKAGAKKEG